MEKNMDEKKAQILCGGTFFTLLLNAERDRTSARAKILEGYDGMSNSDVLTGLLLVADPNHETPDRSTKGVRRALSSITSDYKKCINIQSTYYPFNDEDIKNNFNKRVKNQHNEAVQNMIDFVDRFINVKAKGIKLVSSLVQLINEDTTIQENDEFYIIGDNSPVKKAEIKNGITLNLYTFLLGVWHFIIVNRPDNSVGKETYQNWHTDEGIEANAQKKFISDIGSVINVAINVDLDYPRIFDVNVKHNNNVSSIGNVKISDLDPTVIQSGREIVNGLLREKIDNNGISVYLQKAYAKYSVLKTLMYNDEPKPFDSFYVCNDVIQRVYHVNRGFRIKTIKNATENTLEECSNFIIISGTGGLGKSMMMRHLLLNSISKYSEGKRIPIFIQLKDYSSTVDSLTKFIFEKFSDLAAKVSYDEYEARLLKGEFLLLFDGLDEINSESRNKFEIALERVADKYTENMFIISSRPNGHFQAFNRFTVLELQPFSKEQSLKLIDKLEFRTDEPSIKNNFRKQLDSNLWNSHQQFAENPLLLTIMLMTFEDFAEVPSKMHVFYREAYVALSQRHDAMKAAFKRTMRMGLTADRFADYFAEFCARTYTEQKYELSEIEFEKCFDSLNEKAKDGYGKTYLDFIYDLTANMCLMFYESQKYHFIHRSFQEYFCAVYFSKQKDKNLHKIGEMFEKRRMNYSDKTFDMLYDMIPERIEEYIFRPFLEEIFKQCDNGDGYWTFLKILYPEINYDYGDTDQSFENEPQSFIYSFIIDKYDFQEYIDNNVFPYDSNFVIRRFVYLDDEWKDGTGNGSNELVEIEDLSSEYISEYGIPDVVGWNLSFDVSDIIEDPSRYNEIYKILDDDKFPLKIEYFAVREFLKEMQEKQEPEGTDLFDFLG